MTTYAEKLKDPRWQKKRLEILERDNWSCRYCGDDTSTLYAHHIIYFSGTEPWDYDCKNIITLCDKCHTFEHEQQANGDAMRLTLHDTGIPQTIGACFLSFIVEKHGRDKFKDFMKSELNTSEIKCIYGNKLRKFAEGL